jgi:hypothetical protein
LCERHGLITTTTEKGDWTTMPLISKTECKVAEDERAAFLYAILLRLADQQGVNVSQLMGSAE